MTGQVIFDGSMLPEQLPSNNIVLTDEKVRAEFYHAHLVQNMSVIRDNLFEFCCYLYRFQSEKLYHLLGFEDFKDYAVTALHLSYSLAVRYSAVGKFISIGISPVKLDSDYVSDLGISKLYELSKLPYDELRFLFDQYEVSDLSRKELKDGISDVKAYKKSCDSLGIDMSLEDFHKRLAELREEHEQAKLADQSEESREEENKTDPVASEMIRLLISLQSAVEQVHSFYILHEKKFNGDLLLHSPMLFDRVRRYAGSDIRLLEGGDLE